MAHWGQWAAGMAARVLAGWRKASWAQTVGRRAQGVRRPRLEGLERREVLSTLGPPPFAEIPGRIEDAGRAAEVRFRLEPGGFVADRTMPMLLALEAEPADGSDVQARITHVSSLQGRRTYNLASFRGPLAANVAVPNARPTVYGVGVRGTRGTTGHFVLKVSLPGDADGDGVVDRTDIGRIRAAYGSRQGDRRYDPGADTNADGAVGVVDYGLAHRNLGARASVVILGPTSSRPRTSLDEGLDDLARSILQ